MTKKALIIGGGIAGCAAAIEFSKLAGWDTLIIEKSNQLGTGLKTSYLGGHPYTFGPRHFLSHNESVYSWLNNYVKMRLCKEHKFLSYIESDQSFYSYPIHEDDIHRMPDKEQIFNELNSLEKEFKDKEFKLTSGNLENETLAKNYKDFWIRSIGPTLYKKFIETYTRKMWQLNDESLIDDFTWSPKGVAIKKGTRDAWDKAISAYPLNIDGYDPFFNFAESITKIKFNTTVSQIEPNSLKALIGSEWYQFDAIINTTPIDNLFNYLHGELKFIGRDIKYTILPVEFALPEDIYFSYYCGSEKYTRVTEYKKFTKYNSDSTLISHEYPSNNGKFYPLPIQSEHKKASLYFKMMHKRMFSIGRIGAFNYRFDIDDAIEQALHAVNHLK